MVNKNRWNRWNHGLTIFWCTYSRFSIFCLNVSCFLKFFAQLSLIRHVYNNSERKRATIVCFLKKYYKARAQTFSRGQHCCDPMQMSATLFHYASPVTEQKKCWDLLHKSLTGFKLYTKSANKFQHCCCSMQTDATCWAQKCCVLLANKLCCVRLHGP